MSEDSILSFDRRPIVVLYSDPSALAISFAESLIAGLTRVLIISRKKDLWEKKTQHLKENRSIEILDKLPKRYFESFGYIVFIKTDEERSFSLKQNQAKKRKLNIALKLAREQSAKTLVVLPYLQDNTDRELFSTAQSFLATGKNTIGIVCLGELFGPRVSLAKKGFISEAVKGAVAKKPLTAPENLEITPTYIPDAAKELVKNLFSFGAMGETTLLLSKRMASQDFVGSIRRNFPTITFVTSSQDDFVTPLIDHEIILKTPLKQAFQETVNWYMQYGNIPEEPARILPPQKVKAEKQPLAINFPKLNFPRSLKKRVEIKTWAWGVILFIGLILSDPAFLLMSSSSLWFAKEQALSGRINLSQIALSVSSATATLAHKESVFLQNLPFIKPIIKPAVNLSSLLERFSLLGNRGLVIQQNLSQIAQKTLKSEAYDVDSYSENLALEMDFIYRELGFLESEIENVDFFTEKLINIFLNDLDLGALRQKAAAGKQIFGSLPTILGSSSPTTYLVLFQNNTELRPTGGFIGSFALVTFDKGKLVDISVSDVYEADGQLKGYVEPPDPIRDYLNEANWFLRDSNWDPDFPSSASTAEWFLEKEMGESVDGVLAVDLELAKSLLREIGPIYLADYQKSIDSNNLYEVTQYEVEKDFFPGSQKKAGFLTALTRQLFDELINISPDKFFGVGEVVANSLEEKHIQIFLHDKSAQRAFADLGWDGGVYQPTCSGNCFADWLGVVDANLGVNKANYYIEREQSLLIEIGKQSVKKTLTVLIKNEANLGLGNDAKYGSYLRVLAPHSAVFADVEVSDSTEREFITPEINELRGRKEAGVFVEVRPGQTRNLTFSWEESMNISFSETGEYRLFWRKQAGTIADQINVRFSLPEGVKTYSVAPYSLTQEGALGYNTNLARDFSSRIFW